MLALLGALGVAGCEEDGPPKVPHAVTGREDCLRCHDNPSPGNDAPQVPSDHAGRLENTCLPCHG
jgi:hypothetical protein